MEQMGMMGLSVLDMVFCGWFYDCFLLRFGKVRKWQLYLFAAGLGMAEAYAVSFVNKEIYAFGIYLLSHMLLGLLFVEAVGAVWFYFVVYAGLHFLLTKVVLLLGRGWPESILVISLQGLFVYYARTYRQKCDGVRNGIPLSLLSAPLMSLFLLVPGFWWLEERERIFVVIFAVLLNAVFYVIAERREFAWSLRFRQKEYEDESEDYYGHYYSQLENQQKEIRAIRHDMKNQLIGILGELELGDLVRAKSEMKRILKGIEETEHIFYTANPGMNAILNYKRPEMERKHIHFTCQADIPKELHMEARDIGILVGNILDNAIEGCERYFGERQIYLDAVWKNQTLVIVCENSTGGKVDGLKTRKADSVSHGIGIQSMKRLVKSYGGEIDFVAYDNSFCVRVTLFGV